MSESRENALLLATLADLVPDQAPAPEARDRLRATLMCAIAVPTTHVLRADEGQWLAILPGVQVKTLRRDEHTQTTLWRVQPGGTVPGHVHSHEEECLILEGSIIHDGVEYFPGDFLLALPGERHRVFESPRGALFMIRGEPVPTSEQMQVYLAS